MQDQKLYDELSRLIEGGYYNQAANKGLGYLRQNPNDTAIASKVIVAQRSAGGSAAFNTIQKYSDMGLMDDPYIADARATIAIYRATGLEGLQHAIKILEPVVERSDAIPRNFNLLAKAYIKTNRGRDAKKCLETALERGAFDSATVTTLAFLVPPEEGVALIEKMLPQIHRDTALINAHAALLGQCGNFDKGIEMLESMPEAMRHAKTYSTLSNLYASTGNQDQAIEVLETMPKEKFDLGCFDVLRRQIMRKYYIITNDGAAQSGSSGIEEIEAKLKKLYETTIQTHNRRPPYYYLSELRKIALTGVCAPEFNKLLSDMEEDTRCELGFNDLDPLSVPRALVQAGGKRIVPGAVAGAKEEIDTVVQGGSSITRKVARALR